MEDQPQIPIWRRFVHTGTQHRRGQHVSLGGWVSAQKSGRVGSVGSQGMVTPLQLQGPARQASSRRAGARVGGACEAGLPASGDVERVLCVVSLTRLQEAGDETEYREPREDISDRNVESICTF